MVNPDSVYHIVLGREFMERSLSVDLRNANTERRRRESEDLANKISQALSAKKTAGQFTKDLSTSLESTGLIPADIRDALLIYRHNGSHSYATVNLNCTEDHKIRYISGINSSPDIDRVRRMIRSYIARKRSESKIPLILEFSGLSDERLFKKTGDLEAVESETVQLTYSHASAEEYARQ